MNNKLTANLRVANRYFVDPQERHGIPSYRTVMMAMGYLLGKNTLLTGEPGFSKTNGAKVLMSLMSGLPVDLYDATQIQGSPNITRSQVSGRPNYYAMHTSGEETVWPAHVFMPGALLDEFNRTPAKLQSDVLDIVETGRTTSELGHTIYTGKKPFFATVNYKDDGNGHLSPALNDRFDVSLELGYLGPFNRQAIREAKTNRKDLTDVELSGEILRILQSEKSENEKLDAVRNYQEKFGEELTKRIGRYGFKPFKEGELAEIAENIKRIELVPEAAIYLDCIEAEMNTSPMYGVKRRSDRPVDKSTHAKDLASSKVKNSLSPRATLSIEDYARALAYLKGQEEATKADINEASMRVISHRLEPDDDFLAQYEGKDRKTKGTLNDELIYVLLEGVENNFPNVHRAVSLLSNYGGLDEEQKREADAVLSMPADQIDHPLVRGFVEQMRR